MPMTTKPGRLVTYNKELPSIKSKDSMIKWSCKVTRQIKQIGRVIMYNEELPSLKSRDHFITWYYKVIKTASAHQVTQPSKHVITWDHVTA